MSNVDEVRERTDIVALISAYTPLKKAGKTYKGLCPFHGEKTASFVVYPDEGRWHCFGSCATGGDAFDFVMKADNLEFKGALEVLARRAGVTLAPATPQLAERRDRRDRLREALSMAAAFYRQRLEEPGGAAARAYSARRGMDTATAAEFVVGWAPDEWSALTEHLRRAGFQERELIDAGLAREREQGGVYDLFRARVMFPIHDERGRAVGFGGRTIDPEGSPKYLNSPQSELFDKSRLLYALHRAVPAIRTANEAVVVEGYTDVLSAHTAGFTNVVASLGTALTEHHLAMLKRFASRVVLALDSDAAGRSAMIRGLEVAQEAASDVVPVPTAQGWIRYEHRLELDLRVALLPAGQDPDDVIRADPEVWRKAVAGAVPVLSYMFDALTAGMALDEPSAKTEAVRRLMPVLAGIPDAVSRSAWVEEYANRLRLDPRALAAQLASDAKRRQPARRVQSRSGQPARPGGASHFSQTDPFAGAELGLVGPGGATSPSAGRSQRAEGKLAAWILGKLLSGPPLLDRLTQELAALGLAPLAAQEWAQRVDRDLFTALANSRRGAIPPDTPAEHRLDVLPAEHLRRLHELTADVAAAPAIGDDIAPRALLDACLRMRIQRRKQDIQGLKLLMQDVAPGERDDLNALVRDAGEEVRSLERLLTSVTPFSGKVDQAVTRRYDI